jgi:hypothetical protein
MCAVQAFLRNDCADEVFIKTYGEGFTDDEIARAEAHVQTFRHIPESTRPKDWSPTDEKGNWSCAARKWSHATAQDTSRFLAERWITVSVYRTETDRPDPAKDLPWTEMTFKSVLRGQTHMFLTLAKAPFVDRKKKLHYYRIDLHVKAETARSSQPEEALPAETIRGDATVEEPSLEDGRTFTHDDQTQAESFRGSSIDLGQTMSTNQNLGASRQTQRPLSSSIRTRSVASRQTSAIEGPPNLR